MNRNKILIIDDEPTVVESVLDRLEYEFGADSFLYLQYFDQAWEMLQQGEFSCMSLDLIMPPSKSLKYNHSLINGLNALRQIREKFDRLPIVCYTIVKGDDAYKTIQKYQASYIEKNTDNGFYNLMEFFRQHHK